MIKQKYYQLTLVLTRKSFGGRFSLDFHPVESLRGQKKKIVMSKNHAFGQLHER